MLNGALYGILRFLPLTEAALGRDGQAHQLILIFGLVSIIVAAAFMPAQTDIKRFLAYSTVEHIGIIAVGVGLGGAGTFAALYHALNHSLSKCLAFFSAGRLIQLYGTRELKEIRGALAAWPLWGGSFLLSILALIGVAPFAVFMSELKIVQAALAGPTLWVPILFLAGCAVVFVSALSHAMKTSLGIPPENLPRQNGWTSEILVAVFPLGALLLLGIWLPGPFQHILRQASSIIEGMP
jgi:hydrogenase-4 component F